MYDRTANYLIVATLLALVLAVVAAALFGEAILPVKFLGDIYLNALKMIVIPLLFSSMIVGITNLGDVRKLGRIGLKTIGYFLVTSTLAVVVGMILVNILQPGSGLRMAQQVLPPAADLPQEYFFFSWLTAQIPANVIAAAAATHLLPIVLFAAVVGAVLISGSPKGKPVIAFFDGLNEVMMKIVRVVVWFAPIGVFGLVAGRLAAEGGFRGVANGMSALGGYTLVVVFGLLIHGVIVLPLIVKFFGGKNPLEFVSGMGQALVTAFATASSAATLPITMECAEERNDLDKRVTSLVLPSGASLNMNGTALFAAVAAIFIAQATGWDLSIWSQLLILVTAVLASFGTSGIPQAGLMTLALVLQVVGMPLERVGLGIGLIVAIDWLVDRCRTTINVWGDAVGAAVIATTAEIGIVERRTRMIDRFPRPTRFKSAGRREEFRGKRRGFESARPGGERGAETAKRPETASSDVPRRVVVTEKPREERQDQRPPRRDHRGREIRGGPQQEQYRPVEPKKGEDKPVEKRPDQPGTSRPAFARKPFRERGGKPSGRDHGRGPVDAKPGETAEVAPQPEAAPQIKTVYEVPKFPARILEELTASSAKAEVYMPEAMPPDIHGAPDEAETDIDTTPADTDFSRLDRMIKGEQSEAAGDRSDVPSESAPMALEPVPEPVIDRNETVVDYATAEPKPDIVPKADEDPRVPEIEPSRAAIREDTAATPDQPVESGDAGGDDSDKGNGDDDGEPIRWGRPKRKKPSR